MDILKEQLLRTKELMGILNEQEYIRFNKPNKKGIDIYIKAEDKGKDDAQTYTKSDSGEFIPRKQPVKYSQEDNLKLQELRDELDEVTFTDPDRYDEITKEIEKIKAKYNES